jgi:hypothetical protein
MVGYVVVLRIAQYGRSDESCVLDGCEASKETVSLMVSSARDSLLMRQKLRVLYGHKNRMTVIEDIATVP